jgi:hypothetical protein
MCIRVVLSDEREETVSKEELQFLLEVHQVVRFKRADGWVSVGQDEMRAGIAPYQGDESRTHKEFSTAQDEVFSLDA